MFSILYEDNQILVVSKSAGFLTQSDERNNPNLLDELKKYLKEKYQKKGNVYLALVHRLDRNTGGVIVFAKTSKSAKRLSEQFKNHIVQKKYIVITRNIPKTGKKGIMIHFIKKDSRRKIAISGKEEDKFSKKAILEYELQEIIKRNQLRFYKFIVSLKTGRFHQIRFQFAKEGAPLLGDRKYGKDKTVPFPTLWAYELEIIHPTKKEKMKLISYPPTNWPF